MRKFLFLITAFLVFTGISVRGQATDLFISEYGEGSGNNKWIEIYNGTGSAVDLSDYRIALNSNAGSTYTTMNLSGTLNDGEVYVLAHASAAQAILDEADITNSSVINYNGDDYIALEKVNPDKSTGYDSIDVIGTFGVPQVETVAGTGSTVNQTLVRKATVNSPNADWASSAGTDSDDSEWLVLGSDFTDSLGSHYMEMDGDSEPDDGIANPSFRQIYGTGINDMFGEFFLNGNNDSVIVARRSDKNFNLDISGEDYTGDSLGGGEIVFSKEDVQKSFDYEFFSDSGLDVNTWYYYAAWSVKDVNGDGVLDSVSTGVIDSGKTQITVADIRINEFMADNDNYIADEADEYEDWIELYNADGNLVDLEGYYITDDLSDPTKYRLGGEASKGTGLSIDANGYLLIWADGDNLSSLNHVDLGLSKNGEQIGLFGPDGYTIVDTMTFGEQETDVSYGRDDDSTWIWKKYYAATPGYKNDSAAIFLSSPNNGPSWQQGETYEVNWAVNNIQDDSVTIYLEAATKDAELTDSYTFTVENNGSYMLTVPEDAPIAPYDLTVESKSNTGIFDAANELINVVEPAAIQPGDLVITEIMQNPDWVGDDNGEYFEVHNTTGDTINMNGVIVKDDGSDSFTIDTDIKVAPGQYVVIGNDTATLNNTAGFMNVAPYEFGSSMTFSNGDDELVLELDGVEIDRIEWDGGPNWPDPTGASMEFTGDPVNDDNNDFNNWVESTMPLGSTGDFGTPGAMYSTPAAPSVEFTDLSWTPEFLVDENGVVRDVTITANVNGSPDSVWVNMPAAKSIQEGISIPLSPMAKMNKENDSVFTFVADSSLIDAEFGSLIFSLTAFAGEETVSSDTVGVLSRHVPISSYSILQIFPEFEAGNWYAEVQGTANVENLVFDDENLDFFIQSLVDDEKDGHSLYRGINIFNFAIDNYDDITIGNEYIVGGELTSFNGKLEIIPSDTTYITEVGAGQLDTNHMSIAEYLQSPENVEGALIRFDSVWVTGGTWPTGGSENIDITDYSGDTLTMRIDSDTEVSESTEPDGMFNVVGIASQYDSELPYEEGYQLFPRYNSDIDDFDDDPTDAPEPTLSGLTGNVMVPHADSSVYVTVGVGDSIAIDTVYLNVFVNDQENVIPMTEVLLKDLDTTLYEGTIPAELYEDGDFVYYFATAKNDQGGMASSGHNMFYAGVTPVRTLREDVDSDGLPMYAGAYAKIAAAVVSPDSIFQTSNFEITVMDTTAGITVFQFGPSTNVDFGGIYEITGKISHYNGLMQLQPEDPAMDVVFTNETVDDLQPERITIAEFLADPERYESAYIEINNVTVVSGTWPAGGNENLTIEDGSGGQLTMRIDGTTDIDGTTEPQWPKLVRGVGGQFDDSDPRDAGYQILPRSLEDIRNVDQGGGDLADDLFISEFGEGSSFNKWIEIFNGTGQPVDLSQYRVVIANNDHDYFDSTLVLRGMLQDGDVYVIANPGASQGIKDLSDTLHAVANWNGNDYAALEKLNSDKNNAYRTLDVIGVFSGNQDYNVAGITAGTKDHTLIRKSNVTSPTTDWNASAGTDTSNSQWIVEVKDYIDNLGFHQFGEYQAVPEPTVGADSMNFIAGVEDGIAEVYYQISLELKNGDVYPEAFLLRVSDTLITSHVNDGFSPRRNTDLKVGDIVDYIPVRETGADTIRLAGLDGSTTYYAQLTPLTNYNTDDVNYNFDLALVDSALILSKMFANNFENGFEAWTTYSAASKNNWSANTGTGAMGTDGYAEMNGHQEDELSNDWLISPEVNMNLFSEEVLSFYTQYKYGNGNLTELTLQYTTEAYTEDDDPTLINWDELQFNKPTEDDEWLFSGPIDLSSINGATVRFAFVYQSEAGNLTRWRLDEVLAGGVVDPNADFPPTIENVMRDHIVPMADQDVVITADVEDDNTVQSVMLKYSINEGTEQSVSMSADTKTPYAGTIPSSAYGDGDYVEYYVEAMDDQSQPGRSPRQSFLAGVTPIAKFKQKLPNGELEFADSYGRVKGIATTNASFISGGGYTSAFMQDATAGINVYSPDFFDVFTIGTEYEVIGYPLEYGGVTEIQFESDADVAELSAVGEPKPMLKTIKALLDSGEVYEGMLVQVNNVEPTANSDAWPGDGNNANILLVEGSLADTLIMRIDKDTDIDGSTEPNYPTNIVGIVSEYFGDRQVFPRDVNDIDVGTDVTEDRIGLPTEYSISQNYPNPFNPSTVIEFALPEAGQVTLTVYNVLGQEVIQLVNGYVDAGYKQVTFNASNLSSGVYYYRIVSGDFVQVKKMILLK